MLQIIFTLIAIIISIANFAQSKDSLVKTYYSSGQVKTTGRITDKRLMNGEFVYYTEDGNIDSSITYKNGKLDGLKTIYYSANTIFQFDYHNNKLLSHKIYDSTNRLQYESPLDIKKIPKTTYHFSSGRTFYKSGTTDTLEVNKDVPFMNLHVYFPGATVKPIGKYAWEIRRWTPQPNTSQGKMVVDISHFIIAEQPETAGIKSKRLRHEVILVPIE